MPGTPLGPIKENEMRCMEEIENPNGTRLRSVIKNTATKEKKLELPLSIRDGSIYEPTIVICRDRSSKGQPLTQFYCLGMGLRCLEFNDPWHVIQSTLTDMWGRLGKRLLRMEGAVAYNTFVGPWNTHTFWN